MAFNGRSVIEILESYQDSILGKREHAYPNFYADIQDSHTLVISAGDSWTWGDSLGNNRLNEVYGRQLATHYNADWVNIGCPGWSNSYILAICQYLIKLLKNENYKRIIVAITLTENGRDTNTPESYLYDYIKSAQTIGNNNQFFEQVLTDIELYWVDQLKTLTLHTDSRFEFFIGQNFIWHEQLYKQLKNY